MVDEADRRQISVRQAALFPVLDDFGMSRSNGIVIDTQEVRRKIVEVRLRVLWQSYLFRIVEIKPIRRNK